MLNQGFSVAPAVFLTLVRPMKLAPAFLVALFALAVASNVPPCSHATQGPAPYWPYPGPEFEVTTPGETPVPAPGMPGSRLAPAAAAVNDVPFPFTRVLSLGDTGNDVWVLQGLLRRSTLDLELTGKFDRPTAEALVNFQTAHHMPGTGTLEAEDARRVLFELSHDSWVDPMLPSDGSWQYKIAVTITPNRALESRGLLLDGKNTILHSFPVRLHGHSIPATKEDWPAFDSESVGVNQFTSNGNTPTGLGWLDFNTPFAPEHHATYGPYHINRVVSGIAGNMGFLLPKVRSGILVHTGNWTGAAGWTPEFDMPNSAGTSLKGSLKADDVIMFR